MHITEALIWITLHMAPFLLAAAVVIALRGTKLIKGGPHD